MANEFFTILTATGRNKLANATATATPLNLTQMAVGDGDNGAYYSPTEAQTTLKHEVWRGAINHLAVDANNPNWIVAELVIPDDVGGFYIREVGLFDSAGAMIAVGKFPESYKPTLAAGSNKQLYVRMILEVTNTSAVTLLVDPSVVLATRQYVDQKVTDEINKLDGKQSVRVATTGAIALNGLQTIDNIVLVAGDRVLVKNQAAGAENGIYVASTGAWARAADADAAIEVTPGLFVAVEQGTANADSIWQLVTDAPITLGATSLLWEMASGKAGITAGTYRQVTVDQRGRVTGGTNPTTAEEYGLAADLALPLPALPYPTVATSNNRIAVTVAVVAGQGGTVSVPAGVLVSLGQEVIAGQTGRMRSFTTQAWTSANLAINSTYFLRAQVQNGALTFYVQQGGDADVIPGSLKGTPNGANGGGFDSTRIDMLVAKVVTGAAGSTPTLTALANAEYLYARSAETTVMCVTGPNGAGTLSSATGDESWVNLRFENLNWGRKPKFALCHTGQLNFHTYEQNWLMLPQTYTRYRVLGTYSGSPSFTAGDGVYNYMEAFA
ncbi:MAG: phage tail protein [Pseudomonadota bacterium]